MNPKEKVRELMPGDHQVEQPEEEEGSGDEEGEESEEGSDSESSFNRGLELTKYYELLPNRYKDKVEQEALYAAMDDQVEKITLFGILFGFISTLAGILYFAPFNMNIRIGVAIIGALIVGPATPYMFVSIRAERRKKEMEEILPDALRLVSANIKSGHTLEKAFLLSARDEFGPLADEMRDTAMEIYGGKPVEEALQSLEDRMKSELFQETLKLLRDGIESGGDTADLLDSSADDIRNSLEIRDEIKSSIRMYTIFIMMAAVGGAPILFSISVYMARKTTNMWSNADMSSQAANVGSQIGFNMSFQAPEVNIALFQNFAMMAIVSINLFAALIISEISNGNIKQGIKYVPVFVIISLALFLGVKSAIAGAMGG
ncbi:MAG: type II secretion system F family protein [Candidatus Nanohalobium sp.]